MCNLLAMTYLQQEDFAMVLELLKKAEILTERDEPGKAVTLNNLACYYRRQGKLHAALTYLQRALKIEARLGSKVSQRAYSLCFHKDFELSKVYASLIGILAYASLIGILAGLSCTVSPGGACPRPGLRSSAHVHMKRDASILPACCEWSEGTVLIVAEVLYHTCLHLY